MKKQIELKYDESYNKWAEKIERGLDRNNVAHTSTMINRIQSSAIKKCESYLLSIGYKPRNHLSYRKNLASRLASEGLKLSIKSNRILWLYLDYFLDIDDYTNCFDVEVIIDNIEVATKNTIFISVKQDKINLAKEALIETNKHKINKQNLDLVRKLNEVQKDKKIDIILKVLDNLVEEED